MFSKKNNTIQISKPFTERYTLLIETDMVAVNVVMKSKAKMRWEFKVNKVYKDFIEVELLLLDNVILESNNPMVKDIAAMSQAFSRMYSELHLILDHSGKVLEVLNMDLILDKWAHTKKEMEAVIEHSPEAKDVIILNDSIFQDKEKVKIAIESSEFFLVYFQYVYGKKIPYTVKDQIHNNFLNTASLQWKYTVSQKQDTSSGPSLTEIDVVGAPYGTLSKGWHKKAYGTFSQVMDVSKIETELSKTANYQVENSTGKIKKMTLEHQEIADTTKLYSIMKYTLTSENRTQQEHTTDNDQRQETDKYTPQKKGNLSFLIDDM